MKVLFNLVIIGSLVMVLVCPTQSNAQGKAEIFTARNAVYIELGGNAGRYAINYGRLFYQKGYFKLAGSVGVSMFHHTVGSSTYWLPVLPVEISGFLGKSNHHLEVGVGYTPYLNPTIASQSGTWELIRESNHVSAWLPLRIGYRYQKPDGGFFFRIGYTPFFHVPGKHRESFDFNPIFAGLSLGKSF